MIYKYTNLDRINDLHTATFPSGVIAHILKFSFLLFFTLVNFSLMFRQAVCEPEPEGLNFWWIPTPIY